MKRRGESRTPTRAGLRFGKRHAGPRSRAPQSWRWSREFPRRRASKRSSREGERPFRGSRGEGTEPVHDVAIEKSPCEIENGTIQTFPSRSARGPLSRETRKRPNVERSGSSKQQNLLRSVLARPFARAWSHLSLRVRASFSLTEYLPSSNEAYDVLGRTTGIEQVSAERSHRINAKRVLDKGGPRAQNLHADPFQWR